LPSSSASRSRRSAASRCGACSARAVVFCDGVMFAMATENALYFRVDEENQATFSEAEAFPPLNYAKQGATIDLSFWRVPERLFDEPDELVALGAKPHWPRRARVSEGGDEWGDHVDRLIKHIHAIDPKGGSFRCPHNISGKVFNCTRVEFEGPGREPINPSG